MGSILTIFPLGSNQSFQVYLIILAILRVGMEFIGPDFSELPLAKKWAALSGIEHIKRFHRFGLYMALGLIVTSTFELFL